MRDPHEVLGVPPHASPDEVRTAFRRLARRHHPDRHATAPADDRRRAHDRMAELTAAYHLLTHPDQLERFRRARAVAEAAAMRAPGGDHRARARAAFARQQQAATPGARGAGDEGRAPTATAAPPPQAPPEPTSLADLRAWLRAWFRGETRQVPGG